MLFHAVLETRKPEASTTAEGQWLASSIQSVFTVSGSADLHFLPCIKDQTDQNRAKRAKIRPNGDRLLLVTLSINWPV